MHVCNNYLINVNLSDFPKLTLSFVCSFVLIIYRASWKWQTFYYAYQYRCLLIERINMNYDRRSAKQWLFRYWTLICSRRRRSRLRVFPFVARGSWFTHRSEHASTATLQISYSWIIHPSDIFPSSKSANVVSIFIHAITMRAHVPFECNIEISAIKFVQYKVLYFSTALY